MFEPPACYVVGYNLYSHPFLDHHLPISSLVIPTRRSRQEGKIGRVISQAHGIDGAAEHFSQLAFTADRCQSRDPGRPICTSCIPHPPSMAPTRRYTLPMSAGCPIDTWGLRGEFNAGLDSRIRVQAFGSVGSVERKPHHHVSRRPRTEVSLAPGYLQA